MLSHRKVFFFVRYEYRSEDPTNIPSSWGMRSLSLNERLQEASAIGARVQNMLMLILAIVQGA